jgi:hypothetical protein
MVQSGLRNNPAGRTFCCYLARTASPFKVMKSKFLTFVLLLLGTIAAPAENLFLAEFGTNTISKYDLSGNRFSFTGAYVNGPHGIALDASGNVYVSTNDNTVMKFSPSGSSLGVFADVNLNYPIGLAFDRDGNLYVANFIGNTIRKFASNGADLGVFASLIGPTGIAFDANGNLFVAAGTNTVARFAPDGSPLATFTSPNLNNPQGLAFDSLGNLYVASNSSNEVEVFSPTGVDLGPLDATGLSGPTGLAFDRAGNLYVVNALAATISKITPGGVETIFATTGFSPAFLAVQEPPRLLNISTRLNILTGDNVLDGGFIITGTGTKRVLIRGLGPSLTANGIAGALADPIIELHSSNAVIAINDDWKTTQETEVAGTGIPPASDAESAIVADLAAGGYTVIERGKNGATGVGLIEIYDLGASLGPELPNISTRGFVDTGDDVMIAGFIAGSSSGGSGLALIRGLGPSLGVAGISDPLSDPVLELHNANGTLLASNDNWRTTQQSQIEATGLAPADDAEAAILISLAPGAYTAIESGANGDTGVGLIEVYNLH